tara:strand:- start:1537 stop:2640 length:1104 start_codon:yes stop_codon:yes gene_type:complete
MSDYNKTFKILFKTLGVILALYLFLVGIKGLSSGIKMLGGDFANQIMTTTSNPFISLLVGILATTLFQSSSTTTSIIVGMVSSGAVTLSGAIPMIMGANIGTTVTNTIVSMGHIRRGNEFKRAFSAATHHDIFNVLSVIILLPLEIAFGLIEKTATGLGTLLFGTISTDEVFQSPIKAAIKWGSKHVQSLSFDSVTLYIILSVLLTFAMLFFIVKLLRSLVLENIQQYFDKFIFKSAARAMFAGIILTIMVQSSSITTSTIVPLAGAGVVRLHQLYPFTIGANVGTTVTALLASLTLNVTAMVAGFAHLFFNIFGIVLIFLNPLLKNIPLDLADWLSEKAVENRFIPLFYLLLFFFILPFTFIYFWR